MQFTTDAAIVASLLLLVPSPAMALFRWWRGRQTPPPLAASDDEAGRLAYEAHTGALTATPWADLVEHSRSHWRTVGRAARGLTVLAACLLFAVGCLGAQVRSPKREIAASLDDNGADMAAFKQWSLARQTVILDRCEAQLRSPVAGRVVTVDDCERRVSRFLATRDEALKLWKGQGKTLKLMLGLVEDNATTGGAQ